MAGISISGGGFLVPGASLTPIGTTREDSTNVLTRGGNGTPESAGQSAGTDQVSFSPEALGRSKELRGEATRADKTPAGAQQLSGEEQKQVQELKSRDTEVQQHEQAHLAVAGAYARGGASYEYTRGPDGKQYATGGEVSIDTSPEKTPEATLAKAQLVRRAAMAPANPSSQDRSVAAQASQLEAQARQQIAQETTDKLQAPKGQGETAGYPGTSQSIAVNQGGSAGVPSAYQEIGRSIPQGSLNLQA